MDDFLSLAIVVLLYLVAPLVAIAGILIGSEVTSLSGGAVFVFALALLMMAYSK